MADDFSNMVQIRLHHLSGDSKDEDKPIHEIILHNDEVSTDLRFLSQDFVGYRGRGV
jgi:hypothetical protein